MKLYLDTASVKEIQDAVSLGVLDGVTTNPSLVAKEGRSFREVLLEICNLVDGPVSAEVVGVEADAMIKEGRELAKVHKNVVVKVPLIPGGIACDAEDGLGGDPCKRHAVLLSHSGAAGRKGGRMVRLTLYRTPGRCEYQWDGINQADPDDLPKLRL